MFFDPGRMSLPNFTDMGGKTGPQNITQIVEQLASCP
jgi:hypothetical protein